MIKILGEGKGKEILKSLSEKLDEIVKKEIGNVNTNVILVSKDQIKEMNREFRGEDFPTDVLTFPLFEEGHYVIGFCHELFNYVPSWPVPPERLDLHSFHTSST